MTTEQRKKIKELAKEWSAINGISGAGVLIAQHSRFREVESVWEAGYLKAAQELESKDKRIADLEQWKKEQIESSRK
jgi:hypothetical protein